MIAPNIKIINLKKNIAEKDKLIVFENNYSLPFKNKRSFFITNVKGLRGGHAHFKCKQFIICLNGKIQFEWANTKIRKKIILNDFTKGIYIPPMIWCSQKYYSKNTVLLVFCDRPYEKNDYIHDYDQYKKIMKKKYD